MDSSSEGIILSYNCSNIGCANIESKQTTCKGFVDCELTRLCDTIKCPICHSDTEIVGIRFKNSKLVIKGTLENRKEFNKVINKENLITLKTNLDSIAFAYINVERYDENLEIQTALEKFNLDEFDNESESTDVMYSEGKRIFFKHLNITKGINFRIEQETSLSEYKEELVSNFSIPFHCCRFYFKNKRIHYIDKNIDTSENFCIQLVNAKEINYLDIEIHIYKDTTDVCYNIVLDEPFSKKIYDALMELRLIYDLKDIFRGSFELKGLDKREININDFIRKEIHSRIDLIVIYPRVVINTSICYNKNKTEIFSFIEGNQSNAIINQSSLYLGKDKKNLSFSSEDNIITENVDFIINQDYEYLSLFVEDCPDGFQNLEAVSFSN